MLISVAAGSTIVFALGGAVSTKNQNSASPTIDVIAGILSFVLAGLLWYRERDDRGTLREAAKEKKNGDSWTQRTRQTGTVIGVYLTVTGVSGLT